MKGDTRLTSHFRVRISHRLEFFPLVRILPVARSCQDHTSKKEELTEAITNPDKLIAGRWLHGSISQVNDAGGQGCFLRRPHNRCQLPSTVAKWRQLYTCNSKGRDTESIAQRICKELETSLMTR
ncbi:hypothetical protein M758_4G253900 [Ceratodon purpureus]|nr:hypothetical protein M758_4G253900 [Ceratodon purpureus]